MGYSEDAIELATEIAAGSIAWKDVKATTQALGWDARRSLMAHNELTPLMQESGRLSLEGLQELGILTSGPAEDGLASMEIRRNIVQMLKTGKYAKPFDDGRFAFVSIMGTSDWDDYAALVLRMIQVDTLLNIEQKLDLLLDRLPTDSDVPPQEQGPVHNEP
jgi:hypothetical protein